ncbi:hypothetical protein C7H84_34205 [Burkholderia sp. Nafp2/4-1b]|nr:hypothetical protein C7H84_34205 [Burkholderia sp. Nafp2/4-1b]
MLAPRDFFQTMVHQSAKYFAFLVHLRYQFLNGGDTMRVRMLIGAPLKDHVARYMAQVERSRSVVQLKSRLGRGARHFVQKVGGVRIIAMDFDYCFYLSRAEFACRDWPGFVYRERANRRSANNRSDREHDVVSIGLRMTTV